jgi:hypothetical protein
MSIIVMDCYAVRVNEYRLEVMVMLLVSNAMVMLSTRINICRMVMIALGVVKVNRFKQLNVVCV